MPHTTMHSHETDRGFSCQEVGMPIPGRSAAPPPFQLAKGSSEWAMEGEVPTGDAEVYFSETAPEHFRKAIEKVKGRFPKADHGDLYTEKFISNCEAVLEKLVDLKELLQAERLSPGIQGALFAIYEKLPMKIKLIQQKVDPESMMPDHEKKACINSCMSQIVHLFGPALKTPRSADAKGRAHEKNIRDSKGKFTYHPEWLDHVSIGGKNLAQHTAAENAPSTKEDAIEEGANEAPIKVDGKLPGDIETRPDLGLDPPASPQTFSLEKKPNYMSRYPGQYEVMQKTNARGYAWLHDLSGWQTKKWEWLHIRAASLGGVTRPENLIAGHRDANTHMIPFERHILELSELVGKTTELKSLEVKFQLAGKKASHAYETLTMEWELQPAESAEREIKNLAESSKGKADIKPLKGDARLLSKIEVDIIQKRLAESRSMEKDGGGDAEMFAATGSFTTEEDRGGDAEMSPVT